MAELNEKHLIKAELNEKHLIKAELNEKHLPCECVEKSY